MAPKSGDIQRKLTDEYNIFFDGAVDSISPSDWPSNCNTIFEHIRQLGRTELSKYRDSITADSLQCPWRSEVRGRADRVAKMAKRCKDGRKNESGWRFSLEPEIMFRLTVEITCRNCRGRLWRSEKEAASSEKKGEDDLNSLEACQSRRRPCSCDPAGPSNNMYEQGISPLFDDRVEEGIVYPEELQERLPQRENRPDRVYGLRRTSRLKRLLNRTRGRSIGESVKATPFKHEHEQHQIVFPFLIIEAKSEKGEYSWSDIETQTGFAIRELLLLQRNLGQAAEESHDWDGGPLVWFVSYKGEHWRVHAAYVDDRHTITSYRVVRLWDGAVDSKESALQLLLIMDYIVDWARDIYREGIARSLQKLAISDSKSLAQDTDIFSLAENAMDWSHWINDEPDEIDVVQTAEDPLRAFDSSLGVFRDARFIRTRFIGLIITEENLDDFLNSAPSNEAARKLVASLLASIEEACRVRRQVLDDLELVWTDMDRNVSEMIPPDTIFLTVITAVSYLTPDWEQTRELSYVAVAETLIPDLCKIARITAQPSKAISRAPLLESIPSFRDLLDRPAWDNLCACASRLCIYTGFISMTGSSSSSSFLWKTLQVPRPTTQGSRRFHRDVVLKAGPRSKAREFVYELYLKHKIGRNEPTLCIFRLSSKLDEVAPPEELDRRPELLSEAMWPWASNAPSWQNDGLVFAISEQQHKVASKANLCIFIMDPSIFKDGIPGYALRSAPAWHLLVKRYEKTSGWDKGWNLRDIESDRTAIIRAMLKELTQHLQRFSFRRPSRPFDKAKPMTHWNRLTLGCLDVPVLNDFELSGNRPFKRQAYQSTIKRSLLGLDKDGTPVPEPECIIINDDDAQDAQHTPKAEKAIRTKMQGLEVAPQRIPNVIKGNKKDNKTRSPEKSAMRKLKSSPGQKRARGSVDEVDVAESSAHAARRLRFQQEAEERFHRDFMTDEEFEDFLRTGGLG